MSRGDLGRLTPGPIRTGGSLGFRHLLDSARKLLLGMPTRSPSRCPTRTRTEFLIRRTTARASQIRRRLTVTMTASVMRANFLRGSRAFRERCNGRWRLAEMGTGMRCCRSTTTGMLRSCGRSTLGLTWRRSRLRLSDSLCFSLCCHTPLTASSPICGWARIEEPTRPHGDGSRVSHSRSLHGAPVRRRVMEIVWRSLASRRVAQTTVDGTMSLFMRGAAGSTRFWSGTSVSRLNPTATPTASLTPARSQVDRWATATMTAFRTPAKLRPARPTATTTAFQTRATSPAA